MKTFFMTAALVAVLTVPAFAEGDATGTEALGDTHGSFKASTQEPIFLASSQISTGEFAMAQAKAQPRAKKTTGAEANNTYMGFRVESLKSPTGMDGGNRK
jgi:hypothetical protein